MAEGYRRKYRIALIVFSMLIFLDIVGMMESIYNLFAIVFRLEFSNNRLENNFTLNTENTYLSKIERSHSLGLNNEKMDPVLETPRMSQMAVFTAESICFTILFVCNYLGIAGIKKQAPYLLVPWLAVYMVGVISCYIAAFMYMLTIYYQNSFSVDPVLPAATGMVFHFLWYFVKNIFSDLRNDTRDTTFYLEMEPI